MTLEEKGAVLGVLGFTIREEDGSWRDPEGGHAGYLTTTVWKYAIQRGLLSADS